jgi:Na+/melibiose symporter-like transporter
MVVVVMCALISFPLMVEQISKRLGPEYIMFGTSMVYFLAQALAASIV